MGKANLEWVGLIAGRLLKPAYKCVFVIHRNFLFFVPVISLAFHFHATVHTARWS